jgi:NAD+ kinase
MMAFKHLAIFGKYGDPKIMEQVIHLTKHLQNMDISVYIDCNSLSMDMQNGMCNVHNVIVGELVDWLDILDLVIVIGGDGTLLSASRNIVNHDIPVIGVNHGKLGFMTDIAAEDIISVLDDVLLNSNYAIEKRSLLSADVIREDKIIFSAVALNDVVISRGAIGHMIEFDITIDGQFVLSQKSDGVIFSTPTGSTAYSLAAGGAIMHPRANVLSIVPICSQSMSNRPLIVHDDVVIEFLLIKENATQVHFDGQEAFNLSFQDRVILKKHPKSLQLMHPHDYNYYRTLRKKLDWSKRVS